MAVIVPLPLQPWPIGRMGLMKLVHLPERPFCQLRQSVFMWLTLLVGVSPNSIQSPWGMAASQ